MKMTCVPVEVWGFGPKRLITQLTVVSSLAFTLSAGAEPGDVDPSFNAGSILNSPAYSVAHQPDGRLIIGGNFTTVPGLVRRGVARLGQDGVGDPTFDPGDGANGPVLAIILQPDGKVLVGGWFTQIDGHSRNGIARLNPYGSLDTTFDPGTGTDDLVMGVALQQDGRVLIGGYFTHVNGVARNHVARLNANGTVDTTFNPGSGPDGLVTCILLQPDARLLVGGYFSSVNGIFRPGLARFETSGALDTNFNPDSDAVGYGVLALALQPDGHVLVGGSFLSRLTPDGAADNSFHTSVNEIVSSIALQPDGKVVVGGQFNSINGEIRRYLARLNADGSSDSEFQRPFQLFPPGIALVDAEPEGTLLVSAAFYSVGELGSRNLIRLNLDGSLNRSLETGRGISGAVYDVKLQPDRRVLVAGYFGDVDGVARGGIARLRADGVLDESFDPGRILKNPEFSLAKPVVYSLALQPDGKVVLGGGFTNIGGIARYNIARLNPDGNVDPSFDPGSGADYQVYRVLLQSDGKVLIAGGFDSVNGVPRHLLARLEADGRLDQHFHPEVNGYPALGLQGDGKILLGGGFTQVNGAPRRSIARLNGDGTLDNDFTSVEVDGAIATLTPLKSGKIAITGTFTRVAGLSRNRIARLNNDGTLDSGFDPGKGPDGNLDFGILTSFTEQPSGKLLVWGQFTNFNGVARAGVARLNLDGTVDLRFDTPAELQSSVLCAALQSDGNTLFGGYFSAVGNLPRRSLIRVFAEPPAPVIRTQPTSQTALVGRPSTLTVAASGVPPLTYQWYHDDLPLSDGPHISGATTETLVIKHVQFRDSGVYRVVVADAFATVNSEPASLTVVAPGQAKNHAKVK